MRLACTFVALSLLACFIGRAVYAADPDESQEPPLTYSVTVGDKSVTLEEGMVVLLEGTFTNPTVEIKPHPHREFAFQGVRFKYPRGYVFEADLEDPNAKNWTLTGNDFTIMLFAMGERMTTKDFAEGMIEEFGRANCKISNPNAKLKLGKETLSGTTLDVTVATHQLTMGVYSVPSKGETTKLLVLQDSPDEVGKQSKEAQDVLKLMGASFRVER